jgi:hypothetical protein
VHGEEEKFKQNYFSEQIEGKIPFKEKLDVD